MVVFFLRPRRSTHIKKAIDYYNRVSDREFFDDVLADVVQARHYIWRHTGVRPTMFKYMSNSVDSGRPSEDSLSGYFGPDWGWHRFSYKKAVANQKPDIESEFTRLCRERWKFVWRNRLMTQKFCDFPECTSSAEDVDHINPQHRDIVAACLPLLSEEDRQSCWKQIVHKKSSDPYSRCQRLIQLLLSTTGSL